MTLKITFARPTVRSRLAEMMIYNRITIEPDDELRAYLVGTFVPLLTRATIEGDMGFTLPSVNALAEELETAIEAFGNAPADVYDAIVAALNEADAIPNDPALQPGSEKKASE